MAFDDADVVISGSEPDGFGTAMDAGDLDGDGAAERVVGAPYDSTVDTGTGAVYVYGGGSLGD